MSSSYDTLADPKDLRNNKLHASDRAFHDWYRFVLSFPPHLVRRYIELLADIAMELGYRVLGIDLFRTRISTTTGDQLREEVLLLEWPKSTGLLVSEHTKEGLEMGKIKNR